MGDHIFYEFYSLLKLDLGMVLDKISPSHLNIFIFIKILISVHR